MDQTSTTAFAAEYEALCERYGLVVCLNCRMVRARGSVRARGLCSECHRDRDVRSNYATRPRGAWKAGARAWDVLDTASLLDLLAAKLTDRQIAEQIGRTEVAVNRRRRRLHITRDRNTGKLQWPKEMSGYKHDHDKRAD